MDEKKWRHDLDKIVEDFYYCTALPIAGFTSKGGLICTQGLSDKWIELLMDVNSVIVQKWKLASDCPVAHIPEYGQFISVSLYESCKNRGYIILGPFSDSTKASKEKRPLKVIPYLVQLIRFIQDSIILTKYNTYGSDTDKVCNLHIQRALEFMKNHYSEQITQQKIAKQLGLNKSYLSNLFRAETGITFCQWLNRIRIEQSKELLKNTDKTIGEIAIDVGYTSQSYYTSKFSQHVGVTPKIFRLHWFTFTGSSPLTP